MESDNLFVGRVDNVFVRLLRNEDGSWTASAMIGVPVRHESPGLAVKACLDECRPFMGMSTYAKLEAAFADLMTKVVPDS